LRRIYRGWLIVAATTVACLMAYAPAVYGFVLFLEPLEEEFGWSRAVLDGSVSVFWVRAPLTPLIGRYIDRYGGKSILLVSASSRASP